MADEDNTESQPESDAEPAATPDDTAVTAGAGPAQPQSGVHLPGWLAGALVVVLAFVIGGVGFAVGRSTADHGRGDGFRPALVRNAQQDRNGPGGRGGQTPFPGGGGRGGSKNEGPRNGGPRNGGQDGSENGGSGSGNQGPGNQGPGNQGGA